VAERAASQPDALPPDILAEDEPRYLRRQKPLEVRKRKFGKQRRALYLRVLLWSVCLLSAGTLLYVVADFALFSPHFRLESYEQIALDGNRMVPREAVLERFAGDLHRSVLRIPLEQRRRALEEIAWVESARVERVLPNRLRVFIVERTPVAFLRQGAELALIDAYGVVLERPLQAEYQFPVVTGLADVSSRDERAARMQVYLQFLREAEAAQAGASAFVSEVDLEDATDLRATLAGLPALGDPTADGQGAVLVHFGDADFQNKFAVVLRNLGEWRASAGRVESVDLRFERQVVVNPEATSASRAAARP
jgi:cell division protein FtsQ